MHAWPVSVTAWWDAFFLSCTKVGVRGQRLPEGRVIEPVGNVLLQLSQSMIQQLVRTPAERPGPGAFGRTDGYYPIPHLDTPC